MNIKEQAKFGYEKAILHQKNIDAIVATMNQQQATIAKMREDLAAAQRTIAVMNTQMQQVRQQLAALSVNGRGTGPT